MRKPLSSPGCDFRVQQVIVAQLFENSNSWKIISTFLIYESGKNFKQETINVWQVILGIPFVEKDS